MFDLLTNILVWVVAIPVFIIIVRNIPGKWLPYIAWAILVALVVIGFFSFEFVDRPIPRYITEFLTFPFKIIGILLIILCFNWRGIRRQKPKSLEAKYVGEKVDNAGVVTVIKGTSRQFGIALLILAVASNNATSELFGCYFQQQAENAVQQSYRRPVLNLTERDMLEIKRGIYDLIVVPASDTPYEPRLLEVAKFWHNRELTTKPLIVLSGGIPSDRGEGYPCGIEPESTGRNNADVKNDLAGRAGLRFYLNQKEQPDYEKFFQPDNNSSESVPKIRLTQADDMCIFLTQLSNLSIPRSSIIIEPNATNIRRSVERVKEAIRKLQDKRIASFRDSQNRARMLILTSGLETSRAFMAFRREELNVVPQPVPDYPAICPLLRSARPWPLQPKFLFKPDYLFFSARSFYRSELVWSEIKELILYALRFWIRPPLTDERPYFPRPATPTDASPSSPNPQTTP